MKSLAKSRTLYLAAASAGLSAFVAVLVADGTAPHLLLVLMSAASAAMSAGVAVLRVGDKRKSDEATGSHKAMP